jgi:hypothetical protein
MLPADKAGSTAAVAASAPASLATDEKALKAVDMVAISFNYQF